MLSCVVNSRPEPRQTFLLASRDEKLVTASPLQSALTNLDARNSFRTLHLRAFIARRIRSSENCRVSRALSCSNSHFGTHSPSDHPGLSWNGDVTYYCFKSFSRNTYRPPRKCCKQKTYSLAKLFRCNTYKKHGGKGSRLWLTRNPIRITVLSNHQERRSTCVPTHVAPRITNRESPPDGLPPSLPDATIWCSMTPANPQPSKANRPRVGIPWRASDDEDKARTAGPAGKIGKTEDYLKAVEKAGGEGIVITLKDREERGRLIPTLDAYVLPGSQADIEPGEYGSMNLGLSAPADPLRDETDRAILKHALAEKKPVLAICYGCQLLNVYLGGTLIQDLRAETGTSTPHRKMDLVPQPAADPIHGATLEPGSRLASIAGRTEAAVNSSHHQERRVG